MKRVKLVAFVAVWQGRHRVFIDDRSQSGVEDCAWSTMSVVRGKTAIVEVFSLWQFNAQFSKSIATAFMLSQLESINLNEVTK